MDFLSTGFPIGRYFGINVRLHFTFFIYAFWIASGMGNIVLGLVLVAGVYLCILLHEFGHALAARWCGGTANDILLWPLGGLAFVLPPFHPTAHLITTVAGPFVTLVLWLGFSGLAWLMPHLPYFAGANYMFWFVSEIRDINLFLLIFNLIPAFPMDGGRILRDGLWHWMNAEKATQIAVIVSRMIAVLAIGLAIIPLVNGDNGVVIAGHTFRPVTLIILAMFVLLTSRGEQQTLDLEGRGNYNFSIRGRFAQNRRQREFQSNIKQTAREAETTTFHRCAACGRTERDSPTLNFRVCSDCANYDEYCEEHLHNHKHT